MGNVITTESVFSKAFLDLQKDFCCNDTNDVRLIRWIGCTPAVYKGAKTIFSSDELSLCRFFQAIDTYQFSEHELAPGETAEAALDAKWLMIKVKWPRIDTLLESEKIIEIGLNGQAGYIGMTIPFNIELPDPEVYYYTVIKDLFIMNTESNLAPKLKLNNISNYTVDIGVFAAK
jgi:hypothetical protein